jgi:hypothetical protein
MKKNSTKNFSKQDLISARKDATEARKAVTAQTKQFRKDVAALKRKGLIDKLYDARSVTPTKYLKSQIKKFSDVLTGKAQTVKVNKKKQAQYRERGFKVKNGRVVVPVAENEKVYGTHGDFVVKTKGDFGSMTRIDMGLSKKNIMNWRQEIIDRHVKLRDGEKIYFQFYGNNSYRTFQTLEQLLFYFEQYSSVEKVDMSGSAEDAMEMIDNLVIFRLARGSEKPPRASESAERLQYKREKRRLIREKYLDRMSDSETDRYKTKRAEDEKLRREKMKNKMTPEQIEAQKKKARERAKKSYADRSGKNGKKKDSND